MIQPRLIYPTQEYMESYLGFCRELKDARITTYGMYHDPDDYPQWKDIIVAQYDDHRHGRDLPDGWVPYTMLWLVDGDEMVGSLNIRHVLNESLRKYSGHIGYSVRPSRWRQGYGVQQLRLGLEEARRIGLSKVLVTCNDDNEGSRRVIERNGGVFSDMVPTDEPNPMMKRRYWITLP